MSILSEQPKIESALRFLESHDFTTLDLWAQLRAKLDTYDNAMPNEDDLRYTIPADRREWSHVFDEDFPLLSNSNAYVGWQYELTPGQREWLRSRFGMTPARTVSIENLSTWRGTAHPRTMTLRSGEHVNPSLRKHTLSSCTITCVGTFFRESIAIDKAREEESSTDRVVREDTTKPKKVVESLESIIADLGSIVL